ncbi:MAG: hypothetical protein CMP08_00960 [Xanthomonadales bacterium]|nr:hypothetical protein [Xanthomonadales bacterium]
MPDTIQQIRLPLDTPADHELHVASRALRDRLAHALAIEYDWRYHDGPEWAARYWQAVGDLSPDATQASGALHTLLARKDWPRLTKAETDDVRTIFRSLLVLVHPEVAPDGYLKIGDGLWQRIVRAFRGGDRSALVTAWSETRTLIRMARWPADRLSLQREHARLARACDAADRRLETMAQSFPFNMRDKLADPAWLARQRVANTQNMRRAGADNDRAAVVS